MADVDTLRECHMRPWAPFPAWISRNTTPETATRSLEAGTLRSADKMPFGRGNYASFTPENGKECVFCKVSRGRCATRPAGAPPRPLPSAPPPPPLPLFLSLPLTGSSGGFAAKIKSRREQAAADGPSSRQHADCRSARAAHVVGGCPCLGRAPLPATPEGGSGQSALRHAIADTAHLECGRFLIRLCDLVGAPRGRSGPFFCLPGRGGHLGVPALFLLCLCMLALLCVVSR
jgi:hypothetical protein